MGEEVLPLCPSPRSLFLRTWAVSSQNLKSVVSLFKKLRWEMPRAGRRIHSNDIRWLLFSYIPWVCMSSALLNLVGAPPVFKILKFLEVISLLGGFIIHNVVVHSVVYWYRHTPFQLIGAKAKFMIEVIPITTLAALHHLLVFNYGYLDLLLGFTTYFYTFVHFMHLAYDIGGIDVLLGLVMQVLVYILDGELLVRALALSFCVVLCFYRYVTYCAPEVPVHSKKEQERLPY